MDYERRVAEEVSCPSRRGGALYFEGVRGATSPTASPWQPDSDGKVYWQIGNPQCTFDAPLYLKPG